MNIINTPLICFQHDEREKEEKTKEPISEIRLPLRGRKEEV